MLLTRLAFLIVCATLLSVDWAHGQTEFKPCLQQLGYPPASSVEFDYTLRSYRSLYKSRQYAALLLKFKQDHVDSTGVISREDIGWVAEASFALAEVESGNTDPQAFRDVAWIGESRDDDPVGHRLGHIKASIGPNLWADDVRHKYGQTALCIAEHYREARPRFTGFFARHLSTLIAMSRFEEAIRMVESLGSDDLNTEEPLGDYLATFVQRYVGYEQYEEAAQFLATVAGTHDMSEDVFGFWSRLVIRAIKESELPEAKQQELLNVTQTRFEKQ